MRWQPSTRVEHEGRRRAHTAPPETAGDRALTHWAARWRRLLTPWGEAPNDYTEFDRTVRGMLNRISRENACRILPLEPSLRGAELAAGDCPPWWAARFAALMLGSYLQVIHTNRHARGLSISGSDNVLAGYLDAMAPLLEKSPRLVTALIASLARLLNLHDLWWPTARLLLLAVRDGHDDLPAHSLGRLPADLIRGRILGFLVPPRAPAINGFRDDLAALQGGSRLDGEKDVVAVLVHLLMFSPSALWPRLSAFGFSLADAALAADTAVSSGVGDLTDIKIFDVESDSVEDRDVGTDCGAAWGGSAGGVDVDLECCSTPSSVGRRGRTFFGSTSSAQLSVLQPPSSLPGARQLYLAASVILILAQRIQQGRVEDLGPMRRLAERLRDLRDLRESSLVCQHLPADAKKRSLELLPPFVSCRIQAALEHALPPQDCHASLTELSA